MDNIEPTDVQIDFISREALAAIPGGRLAAYLLADVIMSRMWNETGRRHYVSGDRVERVLLARWGGKKPPRSN
jgi:hypothetical protein